MTTQPDEIYNLLCRFATGYTRAELLEYSEEETGLDEMEIVEELKAVDQAHQAITTMIETSYQRGVIDTATSQATKEMIKEVRKDQIAKDFYIVSCNGNDSDIEVITWENHQLRELELSKPIGGGEQK